ncbi:MAG: MaoC/PaaZ C-terminal domain-containing protein [Caldimonas manganoxidans]|nr:MaoC/PaaZ C-terminal domain-containing protein [Caldimonas manganoxidans]
MNASVAQTSSSLELPSWRYRRVGGVTMLRAGMTSWTRRHHSALPPTGYDVRGLPELGVQSSNVQVRARDVRAYGKVCGYAFSRHVPATYLHVLSLPLQMALLLDRRFPWPLPGLVHLSSSLRQIRPVHPGDELNLAVWIDRLVSHPKGQAVVLACRVKQASDVVWEGENVYLRRTEAASVGESWRPFVLPDWAGMTMVESWKVARDIGRRYAWVSGDANPIHLHAWLARMFGFRSAIAHGMWVFACALAGLGQLPPRLRAYVEFRSAVTLPTRVSLWATAWHRDRPRTGPWMVQSMDGSRIHAIGECVALGEV